MRQRFPSLQRSRGSAAAFRLPAPVRRDCLRAEVAYLTPFFTETEHRKAGCQHRIFFAQVEYCDNLIFRRRAALDALSDRLLDANRTIGRPDKLTVIYGRRVS